MVAPGSDSRGHGATACGFSHVDLHLWPQQIGMKINVSHAPLSSILPRVVVEVGQRLSFRNVCKSKNGLSHLLLLCRLPMSFERMDALETLKHSLKLPLFIFPRRLIVLLERAGALEALESNLNLPYVNFSACCRGIFSEGMEWRIPIEQLRERQHEHEKRNT
jgi:hypothetical protein